MKGFILGAGIGRRLLPLSNEIPAPMLPILNKPLIVYIIEHFKKFGINEIKINLHHLPEIIDSYLGDGENFDIKICYSLERDLVGTAGAIKRVESYFNDTVLVHYGNCFANIDLSDFYYFHKQKKSILSYAVIHNEKYPNINEIYFNHNSRIIKYRYRNKRCESPYIPAGIFLVEMEILNYIPRSYFSFEEDLLKLVCEKELKSYAYLINGEYFKIEYPKDLLNVNLRALNILSTTENKLIFGNISNISKDVIENLTYPIFLGENSEIKKNVNIKGSAVIGDEVFIDSGTTISNSLILNNSYIGKNVEIINSIVYKNLCINTLSDFGIYVTDEFILSSTNKDMLKDKIKKFSFRLLDILLSLIGIILLSPLMLLIAIAIKIDSPGAILFKSKRIKQPELIEKTDKWYKYEPEKIVYYLKFRTMKHTINEKEKPSTLNVYDEGPYFKAKEDPRVTRVGKFLRKSSLDEIPLLFNVLLGDLSLVGIWGLPPEEAIELKEKGISKSLPSTKDLAIARFKGRLGLAGYWQSRGRSELTAEERTIHDTVQSIGFIEDKKIRERLGEYVKTDSVKGYISLILDTIKSVIKRKGAY